MPPLPVRIPLTLLISRKECTSFIHKNEITPLSCEPPVDKYKPQDLYTTKEGNTGGEVKNCNQYCQFDQYCLIHKTFNNIFMVKLYISTSLLNIFWCHLLKTYRNFLFMQSSIAYNSLLLFFF